MRIWELSADANNYLAVNPGDLRYFSDHFVGRRMGDQWQSPTYSILAKSKRVADFTSWQVGAAFLVTERARTAIEALCGEDVEFLPFDTIKKKALFAVNVLREEDYLDRGNTEFVSGAPNVIARAAFRNDLPSQPPPIFKLKPASASRSYVSAAFGRMIVAEGFTGALLRDPGKNGLEQVLGGGDLNAFPGIVSRVDRRKRPPRS